jgi:hypothetical protein
MIEVSKDTVVIGLGAWVKIGSHRLCVDLTPRCGAEPDTRFPYYPNQSQLRPITTDYHRYSVLYMNQLSIVLQTVLVA